MSDGIFSSIASQLPPFLTRATLVAILETLYPPVTWLILIAKARGLKKLTADGKSSMRVRTS